jgi:hypothetical protein
MQSCYTTQQTTTATTSVYTPPVVIRNSIINNPFHIVWNKIIDLSGTFNWPIKTMEKESGSISTDYKEVTADPSIYMRCSGANSNFNGKIEPSNHGGNVIFIIKEINDFSTRLTVNVFYSCIAKKYRYANAFSTEYIFESSYKVECESSGNFESALFQYLCLP